MNIQVNGQTREVSNTTTVMDLLGEMKLSPDRVAVELNRRLVRSEKYGQVLKEGDEVEVVTFVGGG